MSLRDAIARLAEIRGMKTPEVTDSVAGTRNRATLYRILSGATTDPRTSTMLELCRTLHTDPGELLGLAGLLRPRSGKPTLLDVAQRQAFRELRELGEDDRRLVLDLVRAFIVGRGPKGPARRQRPVRPEPTGE